MVRMVGFSDLFLQSDLMKQKRNLMEKQSNQGLCESIAGDGDELRKGELCRVTI